MTFVKSLVVSACICIGVTCVVAGCMLGTFLNNYNPIFGYVFGGIGAWLCLAIICWCLSNGKAIQDYNNPHSEYNRDKDCCG